MAVWLARVWYRQTRWRFLWYLLALPLAVLVYAYTLFKRRQFLKNPPPSLPVPVVVVGNITVGGTGKTPFLVWLAKTLQNQGFKVGIVARGHGAKLGKHTPHLVLKSDDAAAVGDEALLLFEATGLPVAIARARQSACALLVQHFCLDVILSDDGMQHYAMTRQCEIALIDASRALGNGFLLPAGPLREPPSRLKSVDFIIANTANLPAEQAASSIQKHIGTPADALMSLKAGLLLDILGNKAGHIADYRGRKIHAVAAIGNPERFFAMLRGFGLDLIEHVFADHHPFVAADLAFGDDLPIIMTEKDALKCRKLTANRLLYAPVEAQLSAELASRLVQHIFHR